MLEKMSSVIAANVEWYVALWWQENVAAFCPHLSRPESREKVDTNPAGFYLFLLLFSLSLSALWHCPSILSGNPWHCPSDNSFWKSPPRHTQKHVIGVPNPSFIQPSWQSHLTSIDLIFYPQAWSFLFLLSCHSMSYQLGNTPSNSCSSL